MMYFPADSRSRFFREAELPPQPCMPMLQDETPVPLRPKGGMRALREKFNRATPMHLVLPSIWLGGKLAADDNRLMMENGIAFALCLAPGAEGWVNQRDTGRKVKRMDTLDINSIVEPWLANSSDLFVSLIHAFNLC